MRAVSQDLNTLMVSLDSLFSRRDTESGQVIQLDTASSLEYALKFDWELPRGQNWVRTVRCWAYKLSS